MPYTKIYLTSSISNESGGLQCRPAAFLSVWARSKCVSLLGLSLAGTSHAEERWGCLVTKCDEAQVFPGRAGGHCDTGYAEEPLSLEVCSGVKEPKVTCAENPAWIVPLSAVSAQGGGCSFMPGRWTSPGASEPCFSSAVCREACLRSWPILLLFACVTTALVFAAPRRSVSTLPVSWAMVCWVFTLVSKDERALVTWSSTSSCRKRP